MVRTVVRAVAGVAGDTVVATAILVVADGVTGVADMAGRVVRTMAGLGGAGQRERGDGGGSEQ